MQTRRSHYCKMLMTGVAAGLASCLLALVLAAPPAQASHLPVDLSVTETDTPDPLESGNLTYTLTVAQEPIEGCGIGGCGNSSGTIRVTDTLPFGVNAVAVNHVSSVSCELTSNIICTIGDLGDGRAVNIDIVVQPTMAGPRTLTNTATVSNADGYPDPDTTNNSSTSTTQLSGSYTITPDTRPPDTTLFQKPAALSNDASPRFSFGSSEAPSTFECKMDGGTFQACTSPKQYSQLSEGQHTFQVRAKDAAGNTDQTPAQYTWSVDSLGPKVAFTEGPGNVTNDTSPTWAWTAEDPNLDDGFCQIDEDASPYRHIVSINPCSSPYTFEGEFPDGYYRYEVAARDKVGNWGHAYSYFEVDTSAPKIMSAQPTGRLVKRSENVMVRSDDKLYRSAKFVNIYRRGSSTPLAVYRYYGDGEPGVEIEPKSYLKRGTWYTVKVTTGVNDGANNLGAPYSWSFKTKG